MNEKLKAIYEKVSQDASLMEAFKKGMESISDDDAKKSFIIDFAKEQGITLTMEDFPETTGMEALSDDDLENVAGGAMGDEAWKTCKEAAVVGCGLSFGIAGVLDC